MPKRKQADGEPSLMEEGTSPEDLHPTDENVVAEREVRAVLDLSEEDQERGYHELPDKWHGQYTVYECNDCSYSSTAEPKLIKHRAERHPAVPSTIWTPESS